MIEDGSTPSPAGVLLGVSIEIAADIGDTEWLENIYAALNRGQRELVASPYWYVSQIRAVQLALEVRETTKSVN